MNKSYTRILFTMMLAAIVVLAGCGAKQEPKEALRDAAAKATEMTSFALTSKVVINNVSMSQFDELPEIGMVLAMLKDAELSVDGVFQNDPMQAEFTMGIKLKGDMEFTYNIPVVMTTDKLYVKVPNIPMLGIPETLVNKYIEMDMKELAEAEGVEWTQAAMDITKSQQFSNEVTEAVLAEYDQDTYFKSLGKDEFSVPEDVDVKQLVQFQVTNENAEEAVSILLNKVMPKVIEIMGKAEYKEMLQITDEELAQMKEELNSTDQSQMAANLEELKDHLTITTFTMNTAINTDGIPAYQEGNIDIIINDPDTSETTNLAMTIAQHYKDINKTQQFEIGIPAGDDVVTMEQFQELMSAGYSY